MTIHEVGMKYRITKKSGVGGREWEWEGVSGRVSERVWEANTEVGA